MAERVVAGCSLLVCIAVLVHHERFWGGDEKTQEAAARALPNTIARRNHGS